MSTLYSCLLCGEDMPEVPEAQVCESCDHPGLHRLYLPGEGWFLWEESSLPLEEIPLVGVDNPSNL